MVVINKQNVHEEDTQLAISILNHLRNGLVVIGNPGLGLKKTLKQLEDKLESRDFGLTGWAVKDSGLISRIISTKAGIEGEEKLCEYLARLLKYDDDLKGIVAFASLSYEQEMEDLDYIPDTDTLLVYGKHLLVIDAKNIKTSSKKIYSISKDGSIFENDKQILEVNPSTHIWKRVMKKAGIEIETIEGYACIVNETQTAIDRNDEWYKSHTKLIHIAELQNILHDWVQDKESTIYLNILTEVAKAQIKEEKNIDLDIESIKKKFGV